VAAHDPLDLSLDRLIDDAKASTGLDDFGAPDPREGLAVLLETYELAGLRSGGRKRTRARLLQLLCNRLKIERAFKRHPEIRARGIVAPMLLTGLPRTGTSALFSVLAIDADARPLLTWEGMFPDPLDDPLAVGQEDPRQAGLREYYAHQRAKNPEFDKIHFVDADTPEECVLLLAHTFCDVQNGVEPLMSPYREWFESSSLSGSYSYYRDLLKLLDWQRPGRRWLLKSPAHLWALDTIVDLLPDACIVQTHRDPVAILASYCSMMAALMSIREQFDAAELGRAVLDHLSTALDRGLRARESADLARFFDVDYRLFIADPMAVIEALYAHFSLPLVPATAEAMRRHLAEHPQAKHGKHEYSLADYGLDGESVRERFSSYIDAFGLDAAR
jgi:hypothetical protein